MHMILLRKFTKPLQPHGTQPSPACTISKAREPCPSSPPILTFHPTCPQSRGAWQGPSCPLPVLPLPLHSCTLVQMCHNGPLSIFISQFSTNTYTHSTDIPNTSKTKGSPHNT